jgi:FMN phosphatase YigB (HAD superfamily)
MNFVRRVLRRVRRQFSPSAKSVIESSGVFDREWYAREYPEVTGDPVLHYLESGHKEGKRPGPKFDPAWYLAHYPDVVKSGMNPLLHYVSYGRKEGRQPLPPKPILEVHRLADVQLFEGDRSVRCAVALHLHYADLAEEMLDACLNIPAQCQILVSATNAQAADAARAWSAKSGFKSIDVRQVSNRGRNVASFTTTFAKEIRLADLFCHIHSKKSLYSGEEQSGWRQSNLGHLLGSQEHVGRILRLFQSRPKLGVVAPLPSPHMPYWAFTWLSNLRSGLELSGLIDVPFGFEGYFDYPLGCMFWARPDALHQLMDGRITLDKFAEESGQTDGTLAHAIERALYFVAGSNGYEWIEIDANEGTYKENWSDRNFFQYREGKSFESLKRAIDESKTVSFDIFDSLITRIVPRPDDLFDMVETSLDGDGTVKSQFHRRRKEAENAVRVAKSSGDVGYDEIYAALEKRKDIGSFAKRAYWLEEELERRVTIPRKQMVSALQYALDSGKRVILASDMYLHRAQVEKLLDQCGIRGYHELYLSSESGLRKDNLSLWHHLIEKEDATSPSFLHVGDNEHSDVQLPLGLGIRYYHVMSPRNLFDFTSLGYRLRRAGGARRNPLALGPSIATLCNDPFEGRR